MHEVWGYAIELVVIGAFTLLSVWWFRLSRLFRGGILGRSFAWAAAAAAVHVVADSFDIANDLGWFVQYEFLSNAHIVLEGVFAVFLAVGMYGFYSAFSTGFSKAKAQPSSDRVREQPN